MVGLKGLTSTVSRLAIRDGPDTGWCVSLSLGLTDQIVRYRHNSGDASKNDRMRKALIVCLGVRC